MSNQSIGEFLAELRKKKGLTQEEAAESLGVSAKSVSSWENNRTAPDILILPHIAELYNVSVDEIIHAEYQNAGHREVREQNDEDAVLAIRKRRYSVYTSKRRFFGMFAIFSSIVSIIGCVLTSLVATWTLIFAILGVFGSVTLIEYDYILEKTYLSSEGIFVIEDLTPKTYQMKLACCFHTIWVVFLSLLPYAVYGVGIWLLYLFKNDMFNFNTNIVAYSNSLLVGQDRTVITLLIASVAGLCGMAGMIYVPSCQSFMISKIGTAEQKAVAGKNSRLLIKLAALIPASFAVLEALAGLHYLKYGNSVQIKGYENFFDLVASVRLAVFVLVLIFDVIMIIKKYKRQTFDFEFENNLNDLSRS